MLAVDTHVLVRVLARDNARQAAAADQAVAKGAWVSHLVLAEAVWVLDAVYARTAKQLIAALDLLLVHESLVKEFTSRVAKRLTRSRCASRSRFFSRLALMRAFKSTGLTGLLR